MGSLGALLLAAGLSQRMGALKALLPWQGTSLLAYQASTLQSAGLNPVLVVLGHRAEELKPHVPSDAGVRYLLNPDYLQGKTTSLKAGLRALHPRDTDAVLVLNVDQPRSLRTLVTILRDPCPCQVTHSVGTMFIRKPIESFNVSGVMGLICAIPRVVVSTDNLRTLSPFPPTGARGVIQLFSPWNCWMKLWAFPRRTRG